MKRLGRAFFNRPTLKVARGLLGKYIVRRYRGRDVAAMIAEVEAYIGPADRACHAYNWRRTARLEPLYGDGGTVYVYLVYGMHWMLNFATAGKDLPEAVLIRGVVDTDDVPVIGPGRVTQRLKIDKRLDGLDATDSDRIWIEDRGGRVSKKSVLTGPRIGVDYAGRYWAGRPWRFRIDT